MKLLTFKYFGVINATRCRDGFHSLEEWTPADWSNAVTGEWGEACNLIKKLKRFESNSNTEKDPKTEKECIGLIAEELADTITYIDLLATRLGIDLETEIINKFNKVSDRMGTKIKIER